MAEASRCLVIGLGNPDRGDDGAGRGVARRLRVGPPEHIDVVEHSGEATGLVAMMEDAERVILVDACASGAPAGTVRRFDVNQAPLPESLYGVSSHGLGLATAIELARALGRLPRHCVVYAIEGASFGIGEALSPAVAAAVAEVEVRLRKESRGA